MKEHKDKKEEEEEEMKRRKEREMVKRENVKRQSN